MRKEYDIRGGERGKFFGRVKGHRIIKETSAAERRLSLARPFKAGAADDQRAASRQRRLDVPENLRRR
jgi:hypothetical protein